ncbi:hypothetical protein ACFUJR_32555 [Streptomyces sp. NPDC057271]|uniref:hypothetical protein n=1 Tax=unclassified Streptomyces TaxID=2593676 RepID=UPI00362A9E91
MTASINSDAAVRRFANNSVRSMAEMDTSAHSSANAMKALKGAAISLAPAAIPIAAAFAPIAPAAGAAGLAIAAFGVALGGQIGPLGEAAEAEKKYSEAVEETGARSQEAVEAQVEYARAMAKLPPATRQAAAALSVLKDEYKEWSDGLAADTMAPVTKGFAVLGALLPRLTPTVRNASSELDRLMTLAGGAMMSPGLDAFMVRLDGYTSGTIRRANDALVHLMRTSGSGEVGGALSEFMDYARAQGPLVADTLKQVATALLNVLEAGADVGVGMLTVVNALAGLVAAVPPEAITAMLQLAIAIKAVHLAAAGLAAGRAAMAAFATQVVAMRAAAAGSTGALAGFTAGVGAMSRGVKLAIAGSGIGLLLILLSELSSASKGAPADLDKMTSSLGQFARTGQLTGEAARILGADFGELETSLRTLARPSNYESTIQGIGDLVNIDSGPVRAANETFDALNDSLSNLARSGNAQIAEAVIRKVAAQMGNLTEDELRAQLTGYKETLKDIAFEQQLAAESMGLFGQQALQTKQKLDAQKLSADGLRQAIVALNDVNRAGISAQIGFEAAIDDATEAAKKNAGSLRLVDGELDLNTAKSRTAAGALNSLAAKTDEAASAARESGASWQTVNGIYERGRQQLIKNAMQMGLNKDQAKRLADQILKTPDKTARLKGNLEDLEAKLRTAKDKLGKVPDSRKAAIRAEIKQLQDQIAKAKGEIASVKGKTVSVMIEYRKKNSGASDFAKSIGGYAGGGNPRAGEWAWVGEQGPELVQFRQPGTKVYDHQTSMEMVGGFGGALPAGPVLAAAPMTAPAPGRAAGPGSQMHVTNNYVTVQGAIDPVGTAKSVERVLLKLQRTSGN